MRPAYIGYVANATVMQNILNETLHELVGAKQKDASVPEHTVVAFSYPGWPTATYVRDLSFKMADAMRDKGLTLAKEKYRDFKEDKTKLTVDMVNEMWGEAAKIVREEIYTSLETPRGPEVPGLRESLEKGAIIPASRNPIPVMLDLAREEMQKKAESVDKEMLLQIFRNKFFAFLQREFGLFQEHNQEPTSELKPRMR